MFANLSLVFQTYGGLRALLRSSYIYVALILTALLHRKVHSGGWTDYTMQIIPNLLGFSIAALTVVMSIGNDRFRQSMAQVQTLSASESDLTVTVANFIWFIAIQVCALLVALVYDARPFPSVGATWGGELSHIDAAANIVFSSVGTVLLFYSLTLILAAVFQAYHLFRLFVRNQ